MRKSILEQLYDGEIHPAAHIQPTSQEYLDASQKLEDEKEYFCSKLSEEDKERFADFCDLFDTVHNFYAYEDFASGYKMAAKLALAAYEEGQKRADD